MKKLYNQINSLIVLSVFCVVSLNYWAQVNAYSFTQFSSTYSPITGGTVLFSGTTDDAISPSTAIGFTFLYNAVNYTTLKVNSNGWVSFGTTTSTTTYTPLSSTGTHNPCLSALGRDLVGNAGGEIRIQTTGVAPNQVCTIQWTSFKRYLGTDDFNFQIKLYETSNTIEFVYGTMTTSASNADYDCGITGTTNADYNARTSTTSWSGSIAATANTANMTISPSVFPAVGQVYRWVAPPVTPPTPFQVAPTVSCSAGTNLDVSGTPAADETWYWQSTASGTSLVNPYLGPYNVLSNGTYYLRAYNSVTMLWSLNSSSVTVSDFPLASPPPAAVAGANPACLSTQLIADPAGPGYAYYWQGTAAGTSNAQPANVPYDVTATGNYFVAAYEMASQCWSSSVSTSVTIVTSPPPVPTVGASNYVYCSGLVSMPITASVASGTLEWFDSSTGGNLLGTGSPFETVGTSVLPNSSTTGTYTFYVGSNNACPSTRAAINVVIADVVAVITPVNETCTNYGNGTFSVSSSSCGTAPFTFSVNGGAFGPAPTNLTAATYSVVIMDAMGLTSSPMNVVIGTNSTYFPNAPTVTTNEYYICSGATSLMLDATAPNSGNILLNSGTINLAIPDNQPAGGVTNGLIVSGIPAGATVTNLSVTVNITHTWDADLDIYITGANGTQIELSTDNGGSGDNYINTVFSSSGGPLITAGTAPFTGTYTPEGNMNLLLTGLLNGTWTLRVADDLTGDLGTLNNWSLQIQYTLPPSTVDWYNAATGGIYQGAGSPFESIGTLLLSSPATNGIYNFYAGSLANGCASTTRTLVTINVNDVLATLVPIDASCNNQANGTFSLTSFTCGTPPFTYSVNGGSFGPAPTNLLPGSYNIVVQDAAMGQSAIYTITIGDALPPSAAYMESIEDDGGQVSWTANGSETQWNVEWGLPGFTPGIGAQIGTANALDTFWLITGLNDNTNYDVYISANCGAGQTVGSWIMVNFTTACGVYNIPFIETFENNSESRVCWENQQELGAANWTYQTGSTGGLITTAYQGSLNARFVSEIGTNSPVTKLISPRFNLSGQDSVALVFAYGQENWVGDQNITKVYVASQTSAWTEIQTYSNSVSAWTTDTLYLSDTVYQIAFEGINNWGRANVIDDVQLLPCTLNPGIDGAMNVCRADGIINLNSVISQGESFGKWYFLNQTFITNDSIAQIGLLPAGTHTFYYIVETPCAKDTTIAQITVFNASSAGEDGIINVCRNEPFDLLSGLSGLVNHGGTWYDPTNNPMPSSHIMASNIPGQFNYDYIVSNGVCAPDTANVVVNVSPSCNWLDIAELGLETIEIYPNPTTGIVYITNEGSTELFSYLLTDLNGKTIAEELDAINGSNSTPIDLSDLESGVYLVKVVNEQVQHTFRIIKQ